MKQIIIDITAASFIGICVGYVFGRLNVNSGWGIKAWAIVASGVIAFGSFLGLKYFNII